MGKRGSNLRVQLDHLGVIPNRTLMIVRKEQALGTRKIGRHGRTPAIDHARKIRQRFLVPLQPIIRFSA